MKSVVVQIWLLFVFASGIMAQNIVTVDLQKNSYLAINGSTNIIPFRLIQAGDKFPDRELTFTTTKDQNKILLDHNQISIAVKDFTSDNKMALHDFLKLVKSNIYPKLQVNINRLEINQYAGKENPLSGSALVDITITGVTKKYAIPITSNNDGAFYFVDGKKKMSIRDFGLEPPVRMMGLIKVNEWIDIDFHLIFKISADNLANLSK